VSRGGRLGRLRPAEPQRRCVGCRRVRPQTELLRLAAEAGKAVPGREKPGRGCWLCREEACARAALKTGQIPRALRGAAAAPELGRLLEWMGSRSLDGDGGHGLKS
jgi:predicted RNA-binding protein YlxR (DUF448 family)